LDGDGRDDAWKAARETKVVARWVFPANASKSTDVSIRSVHTDTHVYSLARWRDATRDDQMAVSAHDRTGDMDKASGVIELTFSKEPSR
jgi:hypothetical protein